ncbi:MAG: pyridoxal-phosphate dependent enzyme [Brachybacterium sp.]|nr:pyridoxal-phosphate dependent enzyme [Brachybacterium sp.]
MHGAQPRGRASHHRGDRADDHVRAELRHPSSLAWPLIRDGLDAAVTVSDQGALDAAHRLAVLGVEAGPCGAASLAGAREILTGDEGQARRQLLGLGPDSVVVLLITEGAEANPVPAA